MRKDKSVVPAGIRTSDCPASSLVTTPITLSRLPPEKIRKLKFLTGPGEKKKVRSYRKVIQRAGSENKHA
jgi:hypothetical protein